jgi:hypothetical protein
MLAAGASAAALWDSAPRSPGLHRAKESPSFATKFTGTLLAPLKALATACSGGTRACFLMPSLGLARRALAQHRSQHVWFRSLFVAFASCAFANTLMRAEHTRSQTRRLKG